MKSQLRKHLWFSTMIAGIRSRVLWIRNVEPANGIGAKFTLGNSDGRGNNG